MNSRPSPSTRAWARRLLALEAAKQPASGSCMRAAIQVCETLRKSLTQFVGAEGFATLLRRALALARADVPSLQTMKVTRDGCLEGLEELTADARQDADAATAITAHLIELLVTFIGESLAFRLVGHAFPDPPGQGTAKPGELL